MTSARSADRPSGWRERIVLLAAIFSIVVGGQILIGWTTGFDAFKFVMPNLETIRPNAGLCFLLAGLALLPLRRESATGRPSVFGAASALLAASIAGLTLFEHLASVDLKFDAWLVLRPDASDVAPGPYRMRPGAASYFVFLGIAVLTLHFRRSAGAAQALIVCAFLIMLLALAGFLFDVPTLYHVASFSRIAVHAVAAGLLLCLGAAAGSTGGLTAVVRGDDLAATLARRYLVYVFVAPLLIGRLVLGGVRAGLYHDQFAFALYGLTLVVLLGVGVFFAATHLRRVERRRLEAEEALRTSERIYRAIGESIDYGVWMCAPDGRNTYASPSFLNLVGLTQQQCSEFGWGEVLHPDDAERTIAAWKHCVQSGGKWDIEHRFKGHDGAWHPVLARGIPVVDDRGDVICWAGINLDIGRLKSAETSLRRSQQELHERMRELAEAEGKIRSVVDHVVDGIVTLDDAGTIESFNPAAEKIFGYDAAEAVGRDVKMLMPESQRSGYDEYRASQRRNGAVRTIGGRRELEGRRKDGAVFPMEVSFSEFHLNGRRLFTGVVRDITERKRAEDDLERQVRKRTAELAAANASLAREVEVRRSAEDRLRDSEERFRSAFEFAAIGMALVSPDGKWLRVNQKLCDITGYSESELLSTDFQSITHPDDLEGDLRLARRVLDGEIHSFQLEKRYFHKTGRIVDVLISVSLVRDVQGRPTYFVSQIQDVTLRKKAEEEQRQTLLRTRFVEQTMAAREDEQRRIARDLHDGVGQSLTSLRMALRAVEEAGTLDAARDSARALRALVVAAQEEVRRMAKNLRPAVLDDLGLVAALDQLSDDVAAAHGIEIRIEAHEPADMRLPESVETALYRIAQEALTNVVKHARARHVDLRLTREASEVRLAIDDDGIGIDPASPIDGASRFGIAGMRERTALLGGSFRMERNENGGTAIRVSLPSVERSEK